MDSRYAGDSQFLTGSTRGPRVARLKDPGLVAVYDQAWITHRSW